MELNNHSIHPDWYLTSDHTPFIITIPIVEESVTSSKHSIVKNSEEETAFIKDATTSIKSLDTFNLSNINSLENIVNTLANNVEYAWEKIPRLLISWDILRAGGMKTAAGT